MQELMSLIDENSNRIPEGDYIRMCECMKEIHEKQNVITVTPDVVSEDFIMTGEVLTKSHKCIDTTAALRDAYIEHHNYPEDRVNLGVYNNIREACSSFWNELTRTRGYDELMWFIRQGGIAQRDFRYYGREVLMGRV